ELACRLEEPAAVALVAEERGEARTGVEVGETQPVDSAFAADQRHRLQVADHAVVLDPHRHRKSSVNPRNRDAAARLNACRSSSPASSSTVAAYPSRGWSSRSPTSSTISCQSPNASSASSR